MFFGYGINLKELFLVDIVLMNSFVINTHLAISVYTNTEHFVIGHLVIKPFNMLLMLDIHT